MKEKQNIRRSLRKLSICATHFQRLSMKYNTCLLPKSYQSVQSCWKLSGNTSLGKYVLEKNLDQQKNIFVCNSYLDLLSPNRKTKHQVSWTTQQDLMKHVIIRNFRWVIRPMIISQLHIRRVSHMVNIKTKTKTLKIVDNFFHPSETFR